MKSNQRRESLRDKSGEAARYVIGWVLAVMLIIPAIVIKAADKFTMWRIREHD